AGEDRIGECQGAVVPDAERGDRALLAVGVVGAGAVVLGGAFGVHDEQEAVIPVQLNAVRRPERVDTGELETAAAAAGRNRLGEVQSALRIAMKDEDFIVVQGVGHCVDRPISQGSTGGYRGKKHASKKPKHFASHGFPPFGYKYPRPRRMARRAYL